MVLWLSRELQAHGLKLLPIHRNTEVAVRHCWKSTTGIWWWWQESAGDAAVATAPTSPPRAPPLRWCLGEKKKNHPDLSISLHLSFPLCFPLTAAKSHFTVNHRIAASWLSFPAEQAVLRHGMSPVLLISKMPPQANHVNIGECRSGGRAAHPWSLLFIAHCHAGE